MNEKSYPLTWPTGWSRTKPGDRSDAAPFSLGGEREDYRNEIDRNTNQLVRRTFKVKTKKRVTITVAVNRLDEQLTLLGAELPVLSTNLQTRLDGSPRGGQSNPPDPGASMWFTLKGKRMVMACDKWMQVADNIAALAATIRSTRSIERYGAVSVEQAFRGYVALEDFSNGHVPWRRVLGVRDDEVVKLSQVEARYREHIKRVHPDMTGESGLQAAQLNVALQQARAELGE